MVRLRIVVKSGIPFSLQGAQNIRIHRSQATI